MTRLEEQKSASDLKIGMYPHIKKQQKIWHTLSVFDAGGATKAVLEVVVVVAPCAIELERVTAADFVDVQSTSTLCARSAEKW